MMLLMLAFVGLRLALKPKLMLVLAFLVLSALSIHPMALLACVRDSSADADGAGQSS